MSAHSAHDGPAESPDGKGFASVSQPGERIFSRSTGAIHTANAKRSAATEIPSAMREARTKVSSLHLPNPRPLIPKSAAPCGSSALLLSHLQPANAARTRTSATHPGTPGLILAKGQRMTAATFPNGASTTFSIPNWGLNIHIQRIATTTDGPRCGR